MNERINTLWAICDWRMKASIALHAVVGVPYFTVRRGLGISRGTGTTLNLIRIMVTRRIRGVIEGEGNG